MIKTSVLVFLLYRNYRSVSTLKKFTTSEKDKSKWAKVMTSDMMSSEESDSHDEDLIIVKPLQWRHET